jgi:hypothetical protein
MKQLSRCDAEQLALQQSTMGSRDSTERNHDGAACEFMNEHHDQPRGEKVQSLAALVLSKPSIEKVCISLKSHCTPAAKLGHILK